MIIGSRKFHAIISIAATESMAETIAGMDFAEQVKDQLKSISENAEKVLKVLMDGIDDDQLKYIYRYIKRSEFAVLPKYSPEAERSYIITTADVVERLTQNVLGECMLCEKKGKQARRCQIRKDLIACGVAVECE